MYKDWRDSDSGTLAVGKPGLLQCALLPGLTTVAAAPDPTPLLFQRLGRKAWLPPGATCLHQKWIPLDPLFSRCSFPKQGLCVRISLVEAGNMWGPASKSWDPRSSGICLREVGLTGLEMPRHTKGVQICCEARKYDVSSRDRFQTNVDSDHLWRVQTEWLEFYGRISGSVDHIGMALTTWKHSFWVEGCVRNIHIYAMELF